MTGRSVRVMLGTNVLVTGDKDFSDVEVESPEIATPAEYVATYAQPR